MDRYSLAREVNFIHEQDQIRKCRDVDELREVALGLLKLNYGIREFVANQVRKEIPLHIDPTRATS